MFMSVTTSPQKEAPVTVQSYEHDRIATSAQVEDERAQKQAVYQRRAHRTPGIDRFFATGPSVLFALIILFVWYLVTASGRIPALILPAPTDVFSSLLDGFSSGIYLSNMLVTIQESLFGFLLALVIALPVGYGLAKSRLFAVTVHPYLAAGQAIPALVIAPFLGLWVGYGLPTYIIISMLCVLFPMVMNTLLGMQSIDHTLTDAARVEGASGWSLLAYIEFPLALPAILTAIRTGLTLSIVGALVGEFVLGSDRGLGGLILLGKDQYNMPFMFATLLVLVVLAAIYYGLSWGLTKVADAIYYK
jgi:NitT/TauT family transport system permease protein